jgi:hypothetical protein
MIHFVLSLNELSRAAHPTLWSDCRRPIGEGWDEAEVLPDVLLSNPPGRDDSACGQRYRRPKNGFRHENALSVMAERAMPEVRSDLLGLIEPVVDAEIVINRTAPFLGA